MLYSVLRFLFKITGHVFFRNITIRNKDLISDKGPLIIVANHPSAFMDPIVMATMFDRKLYFLAKGILFKSKFAKWILPKFNVIPIYRKDDNPLEMGKNEDTFNTCYQYLEAGAAILIFPEGITKTERKLREIKTGAARIALGAEVKNNFTLGLQIISIGLNYKNPHKFNRDLYINVSEPLLVKEYQTVYHSNPVHAVQVVTKSIRLQLEKLIIAIDDENVDDLSRDIEYLYKNKLYKDLGIAHNDQNSTFKLSKNIVAAVGHFLQTEPVRAETMALRIKQYLTNLKRIGINDASISPNHKSKWNILRSILIIVVGFPFYVYGLINNYLPFKIPSVLSRKLASRREFIGALGMSLGLLFFLIFYSFQITIVWKYCNNWLLTCIYALSLPISGIFAYSYYYDIEKLKTRWMLIYLFSRKSAFISNLITEREKIIAEFDKARFEYEALNKL